MLFTIPSHILRPINDRWAEWATAHPDFGRIVMQPRRQWWCAALLLAHPVLSSYLRPCWPFMTVLDIHEEWSDATLTNYSYK